MAEIETYIVVYEDGEILSVHADSAAAQGAADQWLLATVQRSPGPVRAGDYLVDGRIVDQSEMMAHIHFGGSARAARKWADSVGGLYPGPSEWVPDAPQEDRQRWQGAVYLLGHPGD